MRQPARQPRRVGRDVLELQLAERRQQVVADHRVVVAQRRRLALAVDLDVAQVLRGCVGERRAGPDDPGSLPARPASRASRSHASARALREVAGRAAGRARSTPARSCAGPGGRPAGGTSPARPPGACRRPGKRVLRPARADAAQSLARSGTDLGHRFASIERSTRTQEIPRFAGISERPRQDSNLGPAD